MLAFAHAMIVAPFVSLWFGFWLERSFRQGTTFNLIGYAARRGFTAKRAERAVQQSFAKWDWLILAIAIYCVTLALILYIYSMNQFLAAALLVVGVAMFAKCSIDLFQHYLKAQRELS